VRLVLPLWFAWFGVQEVLITLRSPGLGYDALLYRDAAATWLNRGDPWAITGGIAFAAPPPSLLPFVPLAWMPDALLVVTIIAASLVAYLWVLRRLGMPLWWLLFPPFIEATLVGNPNVLILAALVGGHPLAAGVSVVAKVYAAIPLVLQGRWRGIVIGAGLCLLSLAAWPMYLASLGRVTETLAAQSFGGTPAIAPTFVLVPLAIVGLVAIGRERASWLTVPALWPSVQLGYGVLAVPALTRSPLVAMSLAVPVPGLVVVGMLAEVSLARWRAARSSWPSVRHTGAGPVPPPSTP
jgi:hypothetical protein